MQYNRPTNEGGFTDVFSVSPAMLISGPTETRLAYDFGRRSPNGATFVQLFDPAGRAALRSIFEGYMKVVAAHNIPLMIDTPTWRAHPDGLERQGFDGKGDLRHVNGTAVRFLKDIRRDLGLEGQIFIAGVVGPRFYGYRAEGAPDAAASLSYHCAQVEALAAAGVDLLYAPTFSSVDELLGVSMAFAETGLPYVLAPMIDARGYLPDGHSIAEAVARIDGGVNPAPFHYVIGCVHPTSFASALTSPVWPPRSRVIGLAANGASLSPEDLVSLDHAESDEPEKFVDLMFDLHRRGMKLLGGCCGTGERHLQALAKRLADVGA